MKTEGFGDRPGTGVVQVAAGFHLTVAVTENGKLWSWGLDDSQGSLGLGEHVLDVWVPTQVACTSVTECPSYKVWLLKVPRISEVEEVAVSMNSASCTIAARTSNNSVYQWGSAPSKVRVWLVMLSC